MFKRFVKREDIYLIRTKIIGRKKQIVQIFYFRKNSSKILELQPAMFGMNLSDLKKLISDYTKLQFEEEEDRRSI